MFLNHSTKNYSYCARSVDKRLCPISARYLYHTNWCGVTRWSFSGSESIKTQVYSEFSASYIFSRAAFITAEYWCRFIGALLLAVVCCVLVPTGGAFGLVISRWYPGKLVTSFSGALLLLQWRAVCPGPGWWAANWSYSPQVPLVPAAGWQVDTTTWIQLLS